MSKDPAFLFYPGDWHLGTMHMTLLEKGAYLELLMLQFAKDKFTITYAKHMLKTDFDLVWPNISEKFKTDGEYYWNERLKVEKEKRAAFTESRRANRLKASMEVKLEVKEEKHMSEHMSPHMSRHMENRNKDKDSIINSRILKIYNKQKFPKVMKMTVQRVKHLDARIKEHGWETVVDIIKKANTSDFLTGTNDTGWTANFDWIINPANFIKIMEGNYDNKAGKKSKPNNTIGDYNPDYKWNPTTKFV